MKMNFRKYIITSIKHIPGDTVIVNVKPLEGQEVAPHKAGQYVQIKNPLYEKPDQLHSFSIASSPHSLDALELCIKVYGRWTTFLSRANKGDILEISPPEGNFIWDKKYAHAVFMVGGLGISPIMSMIRYAYEEKDSTNITLLYGNRTEETITYKDEILDIAKEMPHLKVVHILSHLHPEDAWSGYRGFINEHILKNEVDLTIQPTFFIVGPKLFVNKIMHMLKELGVTENQIVFERL